MNVNFSILLNNLIKEFKKNNFSKVYLEGELITRKWQDSSGNDRYSTEVVLQGYNCNLTLLDSRNNTNQSSGITQESSITDEKTGTQTVSESISTIFPSSANFLAC